MIYCEFFRRDSQSRDPVILGCENSTKKKSRNYDALQTLEVGQKLRWFAMTTLNKVPQVKPDLVRVDENWEEWSMEDLIDALRKWLGRNHVESSKCEKASVLTEAKRQAEALLPFLPKTKALE